MTLTVRLLGPPRIERDRTEVSSPRGRKAWALLAYVVLSRRPVPRSQLAELLFADADDPLGALRWTLAQLRRALGDPGLFAGDPVVHGLREVAQLDIDLVGVDAGPGVDRDPEQLLDLGTELLEGLAVAGCPAFESWLVVERHRLSAQIEARLRQAALALLAEGRAAAAIPFAARAVTHNRLEESNHELLVRCLAAAGDHDAALEQVALCENLLRDELGVQATPALRSAARRPTAGADPAAVPVNRRAAAASQLEAGRAAVAAGAVQAGLDCLHRAVSEAASCEDVVLHARALTALGGALVHAVRGMDGEGSVVLHEALRVARAAGDETSAMTACRELGFVEVQAGRRGTAAAWLEAAWALASTDEAQAAVLGVQGMDACDQGDYPTGMARLQRSVDLAQRCGDARQQAWSLSLLGRAHLLRGEHDAAVAAVTRSLQLVDEQRWLASQPWPRTLKAELDLLAGDAGDGAIEQDLEQAWSLSCQLGDPCWEGMAARGMSLIHLHRNESEAATRWFDEAWRRCSTVSDRYQWVTGYVLDVGVRVALARGDTAAATRLVDALASLAARCEMRELVVRAQLHRWRLGDRDALTTARLLAREVDNPALARELRDP